MVLEILQAVIGGALALFVPGYAWTLILFAKKEIDAIERFALSIGLSIALVPLTVFYLNRFAGVPINLTSIVAVVLTLTAVPLVLAFSGTISKNSKKTDTDL